MSLTREEVLHVAHLSNITVSPEEIDLFSKELSPVIDYFNELKEVDTEHVLPTSQTTGLTDVLRVDAIDDTRVLSQEDAVHSAANVHNGFIVVPLILSKDIV